MTAGLPLRAASRAASLTRLARSAPTKPGVIRATSFRFDRLVELHLGHVDLEDLLAAANVGPIDQHVAVEAAGPQQRRVERFGPVRGGHHDHAAVGAEAVHLDQQGVERLLALVVSADDARAAGLAQGVQLVDEDDAGRLGLGLLEHVADAGRADADEHLDEVGAGEAEERHARLAGDRLGQQRLAGARRADQQHALGNPAAEDLIFFGRAEEIDHLAQFVDGLVDAGHVVEGDADVFLGVELAAAAAEGHRRAGAAQPPHHDEEDHHDQHHQHEHRHQVLPAAGRLLAANVGKPCLLRQVEQGVVVVLQSQPRRCGTSRRPSARALPASASGADHLPGHGAGDLVRADLEIVRGRNSGRPAPCRAARP